MIVWGGITNSLSNTGGVYDFSGDTWTTTPTLGAPVTRGYHRAVWTGTQMLVWGGTNGTPINTGGIYDPETNLWATVATTGAPSARNNFTMLWTGTSAIVWGGSNSSGSFNTGGIYSPDTNTWTATLASGAPSARYSHSAVWMGSRMLVWGGSSVNTGGLYYPGWLNPDATPAPTVSFSSSSASGVNSTGTLTISFAVSEASLVSVTTSDITFSVLSGNPSCTKTLTGSSPSVITFTISSCTGTGTFKTYVAAGVAQDAFGNTSAQSNDSSTFTLENTKPTITLGTPSNLGPIQDTDSSTIELTYSETLASGASNLLADGEYTMTYTGDATCSTVTLISSTQTSALISLTDCTGTGTVTVHINANAVYDSSGNGNLQSAESTSIDIAPPTPVTLDVTYGSPSMQDIGASDSSTILITYTAELKNAWDGSGINTTYTGDASCSSIYLNTSDSTTAELVISGCTGNGDITFNIGRDVLMAMDGTLYPQTSESPSVSIRN